MRLGNTRTGRICHRLETLRRADINRRNRWQTTGSYEKISKHHGRPRWIGCCRCRLLDRVGSPSPYPTLDGSKKMEEEEEEEVEERNRSLVLRGTDLERTLSVNLRVFLSVGDVTGPEERVRRAECRHDEIYLYGRVYIYVASDRGERQRRASSTDEKSRVSWWKTIFMRARNDQELVRGDWDSLLQDPSPPLICAFPDRGSNDWKMEKYRQVG